MASERADYQEKVNQLVEEINTLNKDDARLQAHVIELEASRHDISHQNQQLKEHVSVLQSKIQDLENFMATKLSSEKSKSKHVVMEDEEMKTQLESARGLIEKLLFENEKLIEKVNNLNGEVTTTDDPMVTNSEADDETSAIETTMIELWSP